MTTTVMKLGSHGYPETCANLVAVGVRVQGPPAVVRNAVLLDSKCSKSAGVNYPVYPSDVFNHLD